MALRAERAGANRQVRTHAETSPRRAWLTVAILTLLYAFSMLDRLILGMLIGPIKRDLGIGDFQVGLLIGLAFALTYVLLGTPFGLLADRYPRRRLIAVGVFVWSISTIACGFATGFASLFVLRMFVGVGEAALSPASYSLISDLFPRDQRGLPLSIYQTASPIGSALAATLGGVAIDWASRRTGSEAFPGFASWQIVFLCVGAPGLLMLPLSGILAEPRTKRTYAQNTASGSLRRYARANARLLILFAVTFGVSVMVSFAIVSWTSEYLVRAFGWSKVRVGAVIGPVMLLTLVSHVVTGRLMDRMFANGVIDAPLILFQRMALVALPFGLVAYLVSSPTLTVICVAMLALLFIPSLGFSSNALQLFAPDDIRGRLSGAFLSFINFTGAAIGPALVGGLSQFLFARSSAIGPALACVTGGGMIIVCILLALTRRPMREAIMAAESKRKF